MQVSQVDISSNRIGEDSINFRPSPNFKNMKKFFKMKLDYEENEMKNINNNTPEPLKQAINIEKTCDNINKEVQPPLPLDPPPNDDIEDSSTVKVMDHGTYKNTCQKPADNDLPNKEMASVQTPKRTVCRDFLRGTCIRTDCRFLHKRDALNEDLHGIFVFCREYQSQTCNRAYCRYVHATVFEEQEYYRTRYLPPHAFAHQNRRMLLPPPPPPPPKIQEPPIPKKEAVNFNVPPPPFTPPHNKGAVATGVANDAAKLPPPPMPVASVAPFQPAPKRDWNTMETFSSPNRPIEAIQAPKKCKQCPNIGFRYQYNKEKLEKIRLEKEEIHKKIAILDKNSEKLNTFIQALLIRSISKSTNLHSLNLK